MRSKWSHVASLAASVRAMYSASMDDKAMVGCHFEHQLTGPPLSIKMKPKVDFRLFLSQAQAESEYPSTKSSSWLPYVIPYFLKPFIYLKIVFTNAGC